MRSKTPYKLHLAFRQDKNIGLLRYSLHRPTTYILPTVLPTYGTPYILPTVLPTYYLRYSLHTTYGIYYLLYSLRHYLPGVGPITIVICNRNRDYTNFLRDRVTVIVITVQCTHCNRNRNQLSHDPCNRNRNRLPP